MRLCTRRLRDAYATSDAVAYGRELRRHRLLLGLTIDELAERTGYSRTMISDWELGHKRPSPCAAADVVEAVGMGSPYRGVMETPIARAYLRGMADDVAVLIRRRRVERGWTIGRCSRAIGVDRDTWSGWEHGHHLPQIGRLRDALLWLERQIEK